MNAEELRELWEARDHRYVTSRGLSDDAITAVRDWRRREAADIEDEDQRTNAFNEAALWMPPVRYR